MIGLIIITCIGNDGTNFVVYFQTQ